MKSRWYIYKLWSTNDSIRVYSRDKHHHYMNFGCVINLAQFFFSSAKNRCLSPQPRLPCRADDQHIAYMAFSINAPCLPHKSFGLCTPYYISLHPSCPANAFFVFAHWMIFLPLCLNSRRLCIICCEQKSTTTFSPLKAISSSPD